MKNFAEREREKRVRFLWKTKATEGEIEGALKSPLVE